MAKTKKMSHETSPSTTAIVSSAHLADAPKGWQMSELEYALTMTYNAFSRWMIHCMASVGYKDFNPLDILILHNVNHRTKEKRLADKTGAIEHEDARPSSAWRHAESMVKFERLACWQPQKRPIVISTR